MEAASAASATAASRDAENASQQLMSFSFQHDSSPLSRDLGVID